MLKDQKGPIPTPSLYVLLKSIAIQIHRVNKDYSVPHLTFSISKRYENEGQRDVVALSRHVVSFGAKLANKFIQTN